MAFEGIIDMAVRRTISLTRQAAVRPCGKKGVAAVLQGALAGRAHSPRQVAASGNIVHTGLSEKLSPRHYRYAITKVIEKQAATLSALRRASTPPIMTAEPVPVRHKPNRRLPP